MPLPPAYLASYLRSRRGVMPPDYATVPPSGVMPEDYPAQPAVEAPPVVPVGAQALSEPETDVGTPPSPPPLVRPEDAAPDELAAAIAADEARRTGGNINRVGQNFTARLLGGQARGMTAAPSEEARLLAAREAQAKGVREALAQKYAGEGRELQKSQQELQRERQAMEAERLAKAQGFREKRAETEDERRAREQKQDVALRERGLGLQGAGLAAAAEERKLRREELGLAKEEKAAGKSAELEITDLSGGKVAQAATVEEAKAIRNAKPEVVGLRRNLDELAGLVKEHGIELTPGPVKSRMEFLLKDVQLKAKGPAMYQLGVLSGPDLDILEKVTGDPTSLKAFGGGGPEGIAEKMKGFSETVAQGYQDKFEAHQRRGPKEPESEVSKALKGASAKPATIDTSFAPRREGDTRRIATNRKTGERRYINADGTLGEVVNGAP